MKFAVSFACFLILAEPQARALTLRYTIVMGNNRGVDENGQQPFPPLLHAEDEARRLRDRLVRLANFDPSPQRTILLTGASRDQLHQAVDDLVRRKQEDLESLGPASTLFLFFFTGHGLRERILLQDGPLNASRLGEIFSKVQADFTIGAFDACYSGSLDAGALREKGLPRAPGLDLFRELPQEVLTAEGSIWFVSSGPGQVSYEDERFGGVFTHYFIEALDQADRDGPGITLDRIWHYVRKHTVDYTERRKRRQVPRQFVARLRASGPLYFSFPQKRSATLVLDESVQGHFRLSYLDGQLTETIQKTAGKPSRLAVYPGRARFTRIRRGGIGRVEELLFRPGSQVTLRAGSQAQPRQGLGKQSLDLWEGGFDDQTLRATAIESGASLLVGAAYGLQLSADDSLDPVQAATAEMRLDHGPLVVGLGLGYGTRGQDYQAWTYTLDALVAHTRAGYAFDLSGFRLTAGGELGLSRLWQHYNNGQDRTTWCLQAGALAGLLYPSDGALSAEIALRGGASYTPGTGSRSGHQWSGWVGARLSLYFRVH